MTGPEPNTKGTKDVKLATGAELNTKNTKDTKARTE